MTGRSPSEFAATIDQAYGTNVIAGFVENNTDAGLGEVDAFRLDYDAGATTYEAFAQGGDSGAPLFYDDGSGELLLIGINSYIANDSNGNPVATYASYIGNESDTIDAQVAEWALVPEPKTYMLCLSLTLIIWIRRRGVSVS